jgi:hypothetical protein
MLQHVTHTAGVLLRALLEGLLLLLLSIAATVSSADAYMKFLVTEK